MHQANLTSALAEVDQLISSGDMPAAGALLEALAGEYPDSGAVWMGLGRLAMGLPDYEAAVDFYSEAVRCLPRDGRVLECLGDAQRRNGNHQAAMEFFGEALAQLPGDLMVSCKLANCYVDSGELFKAKQLLTELLQQQPGISELYLLRGMTLAQMGEADESETDLRLCLSLAPDSVLALTTLSDILRQRGQVDEAAGLVFRAFDLAPEQTDVLRSLGELHMVRKDWRQAEQCLAKVLVTQPDNLSAALNRSVALVETGDALAAIDALEFCLKQGASEQWVYEMLGVVFAHRGQWEVALESLEKAVEDNPGNLNAWNTLIIAYNKLGKMDKAEFAGKSVLEHDPQHVSALINLAGLYIDLGRHDEGVEMFERALACDPKNVVAYAGVMFGMLFTSHASAQEIVSMGRRFDLNVCVPLLKNYDWSDRSLSPERPLRIGWVSSDLRSHAVGAFMAPLFPQLDTGKYLSYVYDNWPTEDYVTAMIKPHVSVWRSVRGLGDGALAELIRADEIDILVDLNGHTAGHRLGAFARKPAPIQVEWLGYPGTSGMSAMDYVLVPNDSFLKDGSWCVEKPWLLPSCYGVRGGIPEVPVREGLPCDQNGYFTFACMNRFSKVSAAALDLWGRILARLPESRLVLIGRGGSDEKTVQALRRRFAEKNISDERLIILESLPPADYLAAYNQADVCLDPFPFNGGTTGFDSIWMGVPFITLCGDALHSRAGANILKYVGLEALIANAEDEYVEKAVWLFQDRDALRAYRAGLRERMQSSPLLDTLKFAAGIESAFREMWTIWCKSQGQLNG